MDDVATQSPEDPDAIDFLTREDVLRVHEAIIREVSPGESLALRDNGLLESAIMTPQATWDGEFLYASLGAMAAAYFYSLTQNHAFENGNKRVGFAAASLFLRINGYRLTLTPDEATVLTLNTVNHLWNQERATEIIESAMEEI